MPRKTRTRLPNAPKKPASSYLSFCSHLRKTDTSVTKMTPSEQHQHFAELRKTLDEKEKKKYEEDYQTRLQKYRKEYETYK